MSAMGTCPFLTGTCRSRGGLFSGITVSTQVIFSMSTDPFLLPRRCKREQGKGIAGGGRLDPHDQNSAQTLRPDTYT